MEHCNEHIEFKNNTTKILSILEEIRAALYGDRKEPIGVVSRIANLESKVDSLEKARNSIFNIGFKILAGLAVGGVSIKTIIDSVIK